MEENTKSPKQNNSNTIETIAVITTFFVVLFVFMFGFNSCSNEVDNTIYYIGDVAKSGSLQFKVNSVSDTNQLGSDLLGETTNANFIVVSLTIKNIGNEEVSVTSSSFELHLNNSVYENHSGSIWLENGFGLVKNIGAGLSTTFKVAFETPSVHTKGNYYLYLRDSIIDSPVKFRLSNKT